MSKVRMDFVTNSSSSSFVIQKKCLTDKQIRAIEEHDVLGEKLGMSNTECNWDISQDSQTIRGYTSMDNFSMGDFLDRIGVSDSIIKWGDYYSDFNDESDNEKEKTWEELLDEI